MLDLLSAHVDLAWDKPHSIPPTLDLEVNLSLIPYSWQIAIIRSLLEDRPVTCPLFRLSLCLWSCDVEHLCEPDGGVETGLCDV